MEILELILEWLAVASGALPIVVALLVALGVLREEVGASVGAAVARILGGLGEVIGGIIDLIGAFAGPALRFVLRKPARNAR